MNLGKKVNQKIIQKQPFGLSDANEQIQSTIRDINNRITIRDHKI
ncbi:MAG TPA: hypothetical protein VFT71_05930 [Candidatus Nitrosocosmicus sp.]|nr:hypothetical protein [Candidatus Nitrosocosmicus sp.]